jgi:hypothetical protein
MQSVKRGPETAAGGLSTMRRTLVLGVLALIFAASAAFAYVIKLKDGSLIFARMKYTVKGQQAIITLENGTVTAIKLDQIDAEGSEKYNKENFGNVVAIDTPDSRKPTAAAAQAVPRLEDYIRKNKTHIELPREQPAASAGSGPSFQPVDTNLQAAVGKIFDGAGILQYKVTNFRGRTILLVTTNTEPAVFNALQAAARAMSDPSTRGNPITIQIRLTTSSGESAGDFEMTPEQARQLVNGQISVADYFVRNVEL